MNKKDFNKNLIDQQAQFASASDDLLKQEKEKRILTTVQRLIFLRLVQVAEKYSNRWNEQKAAIKFEIDELRKGMEIQIDRDDEANLIQKVYEHLNDGSTTI